MSCCRDTAIRIDGCTCDCNTDENTPGPETFGAQAVGAVTCGNADHLQSIHSASTPSMRGCGNRVHRSSTVTSTGQLEPADLQKHTGVIRSNTRGTVA